MIPASHVASHPIPLPPAERSAITDPAELLALLDLDSALLPAAHRAAAVFGLRVPRGYVARMRRGDPHDPLLRQVLPLEAELAEHAGFAADPVGDLASGVVPGLLQKYQGRALLIAIGACGVNCRFCFRREFPYAAQLASGARMRAALAHISGDPTVTEVILSGGDPLVLPTRRLQALVSSIASIPHVRRIRIHSRQPVVDPECVDDALLCWLGEAPLPVVLVVHANHPREIDAEVGAAMARLAVRRVTLLNQSVLLRGVNDDVDTLAALSERLIEYGVLPYYLHLLDRVRGSAHFEVDEARAIDLYTALRHRLPGYLVPRLVREVAGAKSKTLVSGFGA
jgi:EF-P beta-lysylation protein EpmB